jgi:hypothetical protein
VGGDPITKDDLREAKDDLRREFALVQEAIGQRIDGLKWKILGGVAASLFSAAAGLWKTHPTAAHSAMQVIGGLFQ